MAAIRFLDRRPIRRDPAERSGSSPLRRAVLCGALLATLVAGCAKGVAGTYVADTERWGSMRFRDDGKVEIMNYKGVVIHTQPYVIEGQVVKVSSDLTTQSYAICADGSLQSLDPNYPTVIFTRR